MKVIAIDPSMANRTNFKNQQAFGCKKCEQLVDLFVINGADCSKEKVENYFAKKFTVLGNRIFRESYVTDSFAPLHDEKAASIFLNNMLDSLKNKQGAAFDKIVEIIKSS